MAIRPEKAWRAIAFLSLISATAAGPLPQSGAPFVGKIRLPVSLRTAEGTVLPKGPFDVEVRSEDGSIRLRFLSPSAGPVSLQGVPVDPEDWTAAAGWPLAGTVHLHPVSIPIGTDAERHKSKTGMPQYLETPRVWNATLRLYRSEDPAGAVSVLFHENHPGGPIRARFELYAGGGDGKP
ncbi:MAG: hypothetical protein OXT71_15155 [Acidobacteriota bacterium]|nr:hypothetical protein [Acidobacteriota bacterium]